MASKNERELKVCALSGHNYKPVPSIRLMGQWLEAAGFHIGDPILVRCEDGKLIISLDAARAEMIEAEKAFMEKETRKLHERFLKEKKALHAQLLQSGRQNMLRDRGKTMFDATDLSALDPKYFSIIFTDAFDVTVMSRNTGHYWFIHNPEYPTPGTCIIFHKHKASHPYHQHGRANSLKQAVRSIQSHDRWQMQGRPSKR